MNMCLHSVPLHILPEVVKFVLFQTCHTVMLDFPINGSYCVYVIDSGGITTFDSLSLSIETILSCQSRRAAL